MEHHSSRAVPSLNVEFENEEMKTALKPLSSKTYELESEAGKSFSNLNSVHESLGTLAESFSSHGTPAPQSFQKSPLFQEILPLSSPRLSEFSISHSPSSCSLRLDDELPGSILHPTCTVSPLEIRNPQSSGQAASNQQSWKTSPYFEPSPSRDFSPSSNERVRYSNQNNSQCLPKIRVNVKRYHENLTAGERFFGAYDYYDVGEDELQWDNLEEWKMAHTAGPMQITSGREDLARYLGYGVYDGYFEAQRKADRKSKCLEIAKQIKQKKAQEYVERIYGCEVVSSEEY